MKLAVAALVLVSASAFAEPAPIGHVITAPTAWLPPEGGVVASASLDHRGDGGFLFAYGLGEVAALELGGDDDLRTCAAPCEGKPVPKWNGHATFAVGIPQRDQIPALALRFTTTFDKPSLKAVDLVAVASYRLGGARFHGGVALLQARTGDATSALAVRPTAGLELTPPQYPKTTLMTDFAYLPLLKQDAPGLEWTVGWGVRYQAFSWSSIELAVRHRESEGLGDSTVMVRVNAVLGRR
jgi:hypothetical protein